MDGMELARTNYEKACAFIKANARKLDRMLFGYYFESAPSASVLMALSDYQNSDGGFGHGIEPDFRSPASSPMAASVGLQYCVAVDTGPDHPIIRSTIHYLLETYNPEDEYWPSTFEDVNDAPHAPWWHVEQVRPPEEVDWANPSAEIVGYLHRYSEHVPDDFLQRATERARRNIAIGETIGGWYRYNILCWQRAMPYLPESLQNTVYNKIKVTYSRYPVTQENYGEVGVFQLAPTPAAILTREYPDVVSELIGAEMAHQAEDGAWWPTWQWGQYEDAWEIAKQEWAGKKTVEVLYALSMHDRIQKS
jgi:hypothetical protein